MNTKIYQIIILIGWILAIIASLFIENKSNSSLIKGFGYGLVVGISTVLILEKYRKNKTNETASE
ncbi:MAG: hypothetical protein JST48_01120 [Bacteroidetes bacterium]|nr:hypothetical protein [Bacteroidota bacterium]